MPRKILIAVTAAGGLVTYQTAQSLLLSQREGLSLGWEVDTHFAIRNGDIADIRNRLLGLFLHKGHDDLLFVDSDISWSEGTFPHIMSHKVDVVAGLYRKRIDAVHYPMRPLEQKRLHVDPDTGFPLLEVAGTPAGFLRITRACAEKISAGDDVQWMEEDEFGIRYPCVFDWLWVEEFGRRRRFSEDYAFCHRWRALGGEVWADPALKLNHTGSKTFAGDYMAHMQKVSGA